MAIESKSRQSMNLCIAILLVVASTSLVQSQFAKKFVENSCAEQKNCHDCIETKSCAWCLLPDFGDQPRCFQLSLTHLTGGCPENYTYNPDNEALVEKNQDLTQGGSASINSGGNIVQIKPQKVQLKLRINQEHRLNIQYSQAEDYPVDLYYLMDLSQSMADDKDNLSKLGKKLSDTMTHMTKNFRMGFGSFVDKVLMPYVSSVPKNPEQSCDRCEKPYGFKNQMKLSNNTRKFEERVQAAGVSGNLDNPEGGFDALMQAVVCSQHIGWRDKARRLLVFSTDAGSHYAGDGRLGGLIEQNDGECHMNDEGEYTHSSILDYPSIGHLNKKIKENKINVIFAVEAKQKRTYEEISKHIEGSTSGTLNKDSSNVVDLVKEQYSKISSSVEMTDSLGNSSFIKVTYYSSCLAGGAPVETKKCDGLRVGDVVSFQAEIVVIKCPLNSNDWKKTFDINPVGLNESLTIDLEMLCECPCEKQGHATFEENSSKCREHGSFKCGICECHKSYSGRSCECSTVDVHSESERRSGCRSDNTTTTTTTDCNGRGKCECGVCKCDTRANPDEKISGDFCECDNFSCNRGRNGLLCGGKDNGICDCGTCNCKNGWKGDDCTCTTSTDKCIDKKTQEIVEINEPCNGHGDCLCGECKCHDKGKFLYSGEYCEKCTGIDCSPSCLELKKCVQCQVFNTGPLSDNPSLCTDKCKLYDPKKFENVEVNEENGDHLCVSFDDDTNCRFEFVYNDNKIRDIKVKNKLDCEKGLPIFWIVMGIIASIVLIGLLFLFLWKILTMIHDRREFTKFEKESRAAKWDSAENPIYKQATSTFKNPVFKD